MDFREIGLQAPTVLQKVVQKIGNTPLVPVTMVLQEKVYTIHLKLEGMNPTGSMKDRTGFALIQNLEERGDLKPGAIVVESSSGNLGVALAFICKARDYRFMAVVDPKTTEENILKLRALGAEVEIVRQPDVNGGYLLSRLERVRELCQQDASFVWTNQYANRANPYAHFTGTGPEIYDQMKGYVDAVFVPVSTGGTLAGIGRFFRQAAPSTHVVGVDAIGSVIFGTYAAPRKLTGIGSSQPSQFIARDLYDAHVLVGDLEAFAYCRMLYAATGICVGGSSGATLAACVRYLKEHPELVHVVCVCADRGENYYSTIYDEHWFQEVMRPSAAMYESIKSEMPERFMLELPLHSVY